MTVSYRISTTDAYHSLLCFLTRTGGGWFCLAYGLLTPVIRSAFRLYQTVPSSRMGQALVHSFLPQIGVSYLACITVSFLWVFLSPYARPVVTTAIDNKCLRQHRLLNVKTSWQQFQALTEEGDYLHFFGRGRVFVVPKQAFPSNAEADAFFEAALGYCREAKGIVTPPDADVSGVWPPAPHAGDSQELGGTPKG